MSNLHAPQVAATLNDLARHIAGVDDAYSIDESSGAFLHAMALSRGATRALELGTSYGHSALWIASAMARTGGHLTTIEGEQRKSDMARNFAQKAGVADQISFKVGRIGDVIETLNGEFDFVFIDADKPPAAQYLRQLRGRLVPGAVVVTDNLTYPPHFDWTEFLGLVRHDPGMFSTLVPVGNGMEVTVVMHP